MPPRYELQAVGTDAEVFWQNQHGDPIPSIGILPGTKDDPFPVPSLGNGFALQEDNVMPEFNVPAAVSAEAFSNNIGNMLTHLQKIGAPLNLKVDISPARFFMPSQLQHPQAQAFGCEPDFCVWTREQNSVDIQSPITRQMRSAAAHIHVSFTVDGRMPDVVEMEPVIKGLDLALLPMLFVDPDTFRRQLYGKAGTWRPKTYTPNIRGIEYRVLSNVWISSDLLRQYVFNQVKWVFSNLELRYHSASEISATLQHAINHNALDAAASIIKTYKIPMPKGVSCNVA